MADAKIRIRASDETGAAFRSANSNVSALASGAAKLAGALGGALAVTGLVNLVKGAIDAGDALAKMSQRTGIAVETLGGLGFAAQLAGGSMETIGRAADKLNRSLAEAAAGEKLSSEAFTAMGISATDAAGRTKQVDVAMAEIADRFASYADGPEKVALAMRIMGKAGAEQIVLLNGGGKALLENIAYYKRFSGVSEDVARRSEVFNDTLSKIGLLSTSLGNTLAASLLPSLQAVADAMLELKEAGGGFGVISSGLRIVFETLAITTANLAFGFKALGYAYAGAAAILRSPFSFRSISDAVKEDTQRAINSLQAFERKVYGIGASSTDDQSAAESRRLGLTKPGPRAAPRLPSPPRPPGAKDAPADAISESQRALARYVDGLANVLEKTEQLSEAERALNFLREIGTTGQIPQVRELVLGLAQQIDVTKQLKAEHDALLQVDQALAEAERERLQATEDRLNSLLDATPSKQLEKARSDVQLLTAEYQRFIDTAGAAGISETLYLEAVSKRLDLTAEKVEKTTSLAEELGLTFTSAFEDAIVGGKNLSDVLKGLEKDILRIVTRKLVTEPLGNAITGAIGGSGGIGDFFAKLFSADGGGYTGPGSRTGGIDGRGGFLSVLHPQETVIDHTKGQRAGNVVSITVNQSFAPGTSRATTLQAAADASRALQRGGRNL